MQADSLVMGLQARLCAAEGRQQEADAAAAALTIQLEESQADVAAHQAAGEEARAVCCGKACQPLALLLDGPVEPMETFSVAAASHRALTFGGKLYMWQPATALTSRGKPNMWRPATAPTSGGKLYMCQPAPVIGCTQCQGCGMDALTGNCGLWVESSLSSCRC